VGGCGVGVGGGVHSPGGLPARLLVAKPT